MILTVPQIKKVVATVCRKYGVKSAYLFGSYAKAKATESSDVDLIVDIDNMKKYRDYYHFCDALEKGLGKDVDVTAESGMRPGFYDMIKNDRVLLYGA